jgi:hypothetical protein
MACPPASVMVAAAAAIFSALRLIRPTRAPARARCWAMPRLMPLEAPATKADFPSRLRGRNASSMAVSSQRRGV